MEEKKTFDAADVAALGLLLKPPECGCCGADKAYDETWLMGLLEQYGSIQAAAYAGCIILADSGECKLSDGTTLPDMQSYWLRMAKLYRPSGGRCINRADEILHGGGMLHE